MKVFGQIQTEDSAGAPCHIAVPRKGEIYIEDIAQYMQPGPQHRHLQRKQRFPLEDQLLQRTGKHHDLGKSAQKLYHAAGDALGGHLQVFQLRNKLLLLAVMIPDYLLARYIAMAHPKARTILLGCVIKDIALAVACSILTELDKLILPVGVFIAAFTSVGYLIDLYRGECEPIEDPVCYGLPAAAGIKIPANRAASSSPPYS